MAKLGVRKYRVVTLQAVMLLGVLAGIGLAAFHVPMAFAVPAILLVPAIVGLYFRAFWAVIIIFIFGVCLGWWRGGIVVQKLAMYSPYFGATVTAHLTAKNDGIYGKQSQMQFDGEHVTFDGSTVMVGKIAVSGFGANSVYQGDEIEVTGKVRPGYGSYQAQMSFAKIKVVDHHGSIIATLRRSFAAGMQSALPEPVASFAMGLLIGQRATLPAYVKQDLLMVGLTHIIAVSGYNLTIILHASRKLLAGQSKRIATGLSFGLIIVFLAIAGASASIVRAAIVSGLSISTMYYGRVMHPVNLIAMAAVVTAWVNPLYLWTDISWYLSFLAFFGVMVLGPLVTARLKFRGSGSALVAVGIESICAECMTLPVILFMFGQMSYVGLLANVLVVALVPLAMLLCLFAGLAGMIVPVVAGWFAWPAQVLLNYMLDTSHVLAGVPGVFKEHIGLSLTLMISWYIGIVVFVRLLWYKTYSTTPKSAIITDTIESI